MKLNPTIQPLMRKMKAHPDYKNISRPSREQIHFEFKNVPFILMFRVFSQNERLTRVTEISGVIYDKHRMMDLSEFDKKDVQSLRNLTSVLDHYVTTNYRVDGNPSMHNIVLEMKRHPNYEVTKHSSFKINFKFRGHKYNLSQEGKNYILYDKHENPLYKNLKPTFSNLHRYLKFMGVR